MRATYVQRAFLKSDSVIAYSVWGCQAHRVAIYRTCVDEREGGLSDKALVQVLWSKVCIDHKGGDVGMAENVFEGTKVTACHDEVRGEGLAQDVGEWPGVLKLQRA